VFCNAKYRGGVRRREGLENAGSGGDRVRFPLPLLIVDETGGNARKVKGLASTIKDFYLFNPSPQELPFLRGLPYTANAAQGRRDNAPATKTNHSPIFP
jgi:hypothetical protein